MFGEFVRLSGVDVFLCLFVLGRVCCFDVGYFLVLVDGVERNFDLNVVEFVLEEIYDLCGLG